MNNKFDDDVLVSVVIALYNEQKYIAESIESILLQTYRNIEILVCDDGSTDDSAKIVKSFSDNRLLYLYQENQGKSVALNNMISVAKGEYIIMQDADDVSFPDRIEKLLSLAIRENVDIVQSGYNLILDGKEIAAKGKILSVNECRALIEDYRIPEHDPTMFVRRTVALDIGFDPELRICQGIDFILRVGEKYQHIVTDLILYKYRIHAGSITKRNITRRNLFLKMVMDKTRVRRGLLPLTEEEFGARFSQSTSSDNNLSGHFVESTYYLSSKRYHVFAIKNAIAAFSYFGICSDVVKCWLYALTPPVVNRWGRKIVGRGKL
ncbi:glycosyltransferase family 2 protein [Oceanobacter antarcticus]|uniref:Glycosyltransferase family 2 protein n=1 Tax=Oceanobacter antarcticus TaxID=3133425 RepID=A0ABW8NEF7_9GAMM